MHEVLSTYPNWETTIAPRLILGLWHPKFVAPALSILPQVQLCFIGIDLSLAQCTTFWNACNAFSITFPVLASSEGEKFRERCNKEGKSIYTWTCNQQEQWALAANWNVKVVMTDTPIPYLAERKAVIGMLSTLLLVLLNSCSLIFWFCCSESKVPLVPRDVWFMWRSFYYYSIAGWFFKRAFWKRLERLGGPMAPYIDLTA